MPSNWIGNIKITDETEVLDSTGTKIHDYISCDQGAGVPVDKEVHPVLWGKLPSSLSNPYTAFTVPGEDFLSGVVSVGGNTWVADRKVFTLKAFSHVHVYMPELDIPVSGIPYPHTLFKQGEDLWLIGAVNVPTIMKKYATDGTLLVTESISQETTSGLWDGTHYWLLHLRLGVWGELHQYTNTWSATGTKLHLEGLSTTAIAIAQDPQDSDVIWVMQANAQVYTVRKSNNVMEYKLAEINRSTDIAFNEDGLLVSRWDSGAVRQWDSATHVPDLPNATGSPWPYKVVADLTGGI